MAGHVLTVYNCGTNYHKDKHDVVANLNRETSSTHHINDGVGSGSLVRGRFLGGRENPGAWTTVGGLVFGAGADAIVGQTVELITAASKERKLDAINLCGWSRGGVICFKIANHLHQQAELRKVPVHVFAIDPVPGLKNNDMWQDITLSGNVKACVIVLAQHDLRNNTFRPVVPQLDGKQTPYDLMPGDHSALVEPAADGKRAAPSEIVHAWAKKFLADHGTQFKDGRLPGADALLTLYGRIRDEFDDYVKAASGRGVMFHDLDGQREVYSAAGQLLGKLPSRHVEPTFYINLHESQVFKSVYALLGAELAKPAKQRFFPLPRTGSPLERFKNDLDRLYKRARPVWRQVIAHVAEVDAWRAKLPKS
jgi:hypothetical protein